MKILTRLFWLAIIAFSIGCNTTNEQGFKDNKQSGGDVKTEDSTPIKDATNFSSKDFIGCWTDSREENMPNSNLRIFRPCDYKTLPPSRFRYKFNLLDDNTCSWLSLSPNDAHKMKNGTWKLDKANNLEIYNQEQGLEFTYKVASIGKDLLEIMAGK